MGRGSLKKYKFLKDVTVVNKSNRKVYKKGDVVELDEPLATKYVTNGFVVKQDDYDYNKITVAQIKGILDDHGVEYGNDLLKKDLYELMVQEVLE